AFRYVCASTGHPNISAPVPTGPDYTLPTGISGSFKTVNVLTPNIPNWSIENFNEIDYCFKKSQFLEPRLPDLLPQNRGQLSCELPVPFLLSVPQERITSNTAITGVLTLRRI